MGCDSAQGFYISRPMPPEAFGRWLAQHRRVAGSLASPGFVASVPAVIR